MNDDTGRYWIWFTNTKSGDWDRRGSFHNKDAAKAYQRQWRSWGQPTSRIFLHGEETQEMRDGLERTWAIEREWTERARANFAKRAA